MLDFVKTLVGVPLKSPASDDQSALSTTNLHSHKCWNEACGTIWRHDPDTIDPRHNTRAHSCPICGSQQYMKYEHQCGDRLPAAQFCNNGERTIAIEPQLAEA